MYQHTIIRKGIFIPCLIGVLSACSQTTDSSALRADPESIAAAASQPVVLDGMPADSVRAVDVIRRSKSGVTRTGEIYLMRGLANVFSRGIDDMARQLRDRGYDAANFSYTEWRPIAEDIVRRASNKEVSYPLVIIGHSLGGNESSKFASYLADRKVPVALVVAFDPVETGHVSNGVARVVNYYLPKSADNRILPKDGFAGELDNVDVTADPAITHTNVDKDPKFQAATLTSIANLTGKLRTRTVRKVRTER
ncbi:MAG: lipase family protein [Rhizobiaceae bacterium]